jgi:5-methyltetrahydropteroyltriglutamate--homocysteine methyltransferase
VHACESEDLPAVPGAPRLAAHRLEEWASGRNGCSGCAHCAGSVLRPLAVTTPSIEGPRTIVTATPFTATVTGSPRIGPKRELKRATEGYWAGRTNRSELENVAATLRRDTWSQLVAAGLDSVPVNTFSYYDQMLDTAVLLGALPTRVQEVSDDLDRYFAAARGTGDIAPLEMTKWFDTNYHYIVPEIGPKTSFSLHPEKVLAEL